MESFSISSNNIEQQLAFHLINYTNKNLFITGKAGTGKTTFLKFLKKNSSKSMMVIAPTGVAAINAGGVTIHSMFLLPLTSFVPSNDVYVDRNIAITKVELHQHFKYNKEKRKLLLELDTLIIDEVSMLRADVLDAIDWALKSARKNPKAFGGVQVVMIGDMYQLPPVIKDEQWNVLKKFYKSLYFFDAKVLDSNPLVCVEFKTVYRQADPVFIDLLNSIRFQDFSSINFSLLHERFFPNFEPKESGYITLTTHNYLADEINQKALDKIDTPLHFFEAIIDGIFPENSYPTDSELVLKEGCQVMFIRNDSSGNRKYFNGKVGILEKIDDGDIYVRFENQNDLFKVEHEVWRNIKYTLDKETGKIIEEELGSFSQYPIRLAWAVTIHKSQGLTFDKVIVDAGRSFASGQVYVALSRCRTIQGIVLKSKITNQNIISDHRIHEFQNQMWNIQALEKVLDEEKYKFALQSLFSSLHMGRLLSEVNNWRNLTIEKSIPEKESVLHIISSIDECLSSLNIIHQKFQNTIMNWFYQVEIGNENFSLNWKKISSRCSQAIEYFSEELFQKVWKSIALHYIEYKKKARITQYLKVVNELEETVKLKIKQILIIHLIEERLSYKESIFISDSGKVISNEKNNTVDITLEILKEGKSIEDVAKERNLSISTISNHVSQLIAKNKISVFDFVSKEKYTIIENKIQELNNNELKNIKDALGDNFSYDEIKFVRSHLTN